MINIFRLILFFVVFGLSKSGFSQEFKKCKEITMGIKTYNVSVSDEYIVVSDNDLEKDKVIEDPDYPISQYSLMRKQFQVNIDTILNKAEEIFGHLNAKDLLISWTMKNDQSIVGVSCTFSKRIVKNKDQIEAFVNFVEKNSKVKVIFRNDEDRRSHPGFVYSLRIVSSNK